MNLHPSQGYLYRNVECKNLNQNQLAKRYQTVPIIVQAMTQPSHWINHSQLRETIHHIMVAACRRQEKSLSRNEMF